jgi:hypothetical protein
MRFVLAGIVAFLGVVSSPTLATSQGCEVSGSGAAFWGQCFNAFDMAPYPPIGFSIIADVSACYSGTQTQPLRMVICNEALAVIGEIALPGRADCANGPNYTILNATHTTVTWRSTQSTPRVYCQWYLGTLPVDSLSMWANAHIRWPSMVVLHFDPLTAEDKPRFATTATYLDRGAKVMGAIIGLYPNTKLYLGPLGAFSVLLSLVFDAIAKDPPDENFTEVVTVVPEPYTPLEATCPVAPNPLKKCLFFPKEKRALNALLENESQMIGLARAILTTHNRGSSAVLAQDEASVLLQQTAYDGFVAQLRQLAAQEIVLRQAAAVPFYAHDRKESLDVATMLVDPDLLASLEAIAP